MSNLKTVHGKVLAWVIVSMGERVLAPMLTEVSTQLSLFVRCVLSVTCAVYNLPNSDYYEPWAFIKSDYFGAVCGLVASLDKIKFRISLKSEDLEKPVSPIMANPNQDVVLYLNTILGGSLEAYVELHHEIHLILH